LTNPSAYDTLAVSFFIWNKLPMKLHRLPVTISKKQHQALRELSASTGLSIAEHIRRAIDAYLAELKKNQE